MDIFFRDQKVRINIFNASKYAQKEESCSIIDLIDEIVETNSSLDLKKEDFLDKPIEETQNQEMNALFDSPHPAHSLPWSIKIEPLPKLETEPLRSSIQAPPQFELKPLPESLKYVFLGLKKTLPIIIASDLIPEQEDQLLNVLKTHREAIGCTIADLKGISPSICMHHIYIEDNVKPIDRKSTRLNSSHSGESRMPSSA